MTEINKQLYKTPPLTDSVCVAHLWLARGFRVLPCQPGTKRLLAGFGPHLEDLTDSAVIEYWFRFRHCNIAVTPPQDGVILDFDIPEVYEKFTSESPESASSYTEQTPRGGFHVFLTGEGGVVPRWSGLVNGLEIKRVAMVYPSQVQGRQYKPVNAGHILAVNLAEALQGFATVEASHKATSSPLASPVGNHGQSSGNMQSRGILEEVKAHWPILSYLAYFEPGLTMTGGGRWLSGLCPWHDDRSPSLWVDRDRNTWGCHACPAHGDVINWHARRLHTVDQTQAARDLARYNLEVA